MKSKILGSVLLIAGTTIGAGMVALPVTLSTFGFLGALVSFVVVWLMSLSGSYLVLNVNLTQPLETDLVAMAHAVLGPIGGRLNAIAYTVLLYALCSAYTTALQAMATEGLHMFGLHLPAALLAFFIVTIGMFVITRPLSVVDRINRIMMVGLVVSFIFFIISAFMKVHFGDLVALHQWTSLPMTWPIILSSFGYHIVIPTVRRYLDSDVKAIHKTFWLGTLMPLFIYLIWVASTLGIVPVVGEHSFAAMASSNQPSVDLGVALHDLTQQAWLPDILESFTLFAVITSFLGVALALYDYMCHAWAHCTWAKPLQLSLLTLMPAWLFSVLYPHGFILALEYAAINTAIISFIVPALMNLKSFPYLPSSTPAMRALAVTGLLFGILIVAISLFESCFV